MKKKPDPPAEGTPPEKSPFEKMRDLTRRVIHVPKSEILKAKSPRQRER